ncbi:MAG TPA: acyl-CoA thioesterase domain-containing protein [Dehalococcoidia bacterium]|nr:acyl-CoA thioesterase domain-containing protein [Dehalococcoidia bacterium]
MPTRNRQLDALLNQLQLDQLDNDLFLGDPGKGEGRLFGGLVLAQCVMSAYRTVEDRSIHSLHAYFLRPGSHEVPIRYVVYRIRDGRTFTTRDVVAYQAGEAIFQMSCSFTRPEEGVTHQELMPDADGPEGMPDWDMVRPDVNAEWADRMKRWRRERPIELKSAEPDDPDDEWRKVWIKPRGPLPEDPSVHAAVLAYSSDMGLISTARNAMKLMRFDTPGAAASLDHAIWFHHPPRFEDWLLYSSHSPVAHASRALILGQIHRQDGTQVLSVVQEGLIRVPKKAPNKR